MSQPTDRWAKATIVALLFGCQYFVFQIRFVLGVVAPTLMKEYNIDAATMGNILAGWNWSYTASLLFIGPIVDRLGPWITMGVGSALWSLSTIALPIAGVAAASLFFMRLMFGFAQAPLIPVGAASVSRRFSAKDRARAVATVFSGGQIGPALGATIATFLLMSYGWRSVFYYIGAASLLLSAAWFIFYPDKRIGRLSEPKPETGKAPESERIPWAVLFRYRSTWGIALGQFGYLYLYFWFISWLPGYLVIQRKMERGFAQAIPFWAGLLGTLAGGWLGDYLIRRGISTTKSRKGIIGASLTAATVCVVAAAFVPQNWMAVTLLTLCLGLVRSATASCNSLPIDLAPRSVVGSLTSIQNFFGNVGGLLVPIVTGYIVRETGSFVGAMMVAGGMGLFGAIAYVFIMGDLEKNRIEPRTTVPAGARVSPFPAV